ncbi:hypothetical protein [Xylophilus sp. GOD-11R]|uniref:hypothetical protein n=1 Tax=Xylophilus sp. GOD-11R TaxID=3089814 RepID=UPI00298D587B|nr:hypothetical protein [Xylophilus sp. GOD-11R]WPB57621.1 hypothetical protein R9X41_02915 [Xylophilus sp. GOD-11R]
MHIEIVTAGGASQSAMSSAPMVLAGGEPGRVRPSPGTRIAWAADTVRPVGAAGADPVLMVQVDGPTIVELAGFHDSPGVVLEGGGWMPAGLLEGPSSTSTPSFFGQSTNDHTPLLGGTADAGCLVLVSVGGAVFCVTADGEGGWSLDTAATRPMSGRFDLGPDGVKDLLVTSIDGAGNSSGISGTFTLDTTPPPMPTLETISVDSQRPVLHGRAEPGSAMTVGVGGVIYEVRTDMLGRWQVDTAEAAPCSGCLHLGEAGHKKIAMACADDAGNVTTAEAWFTLEDRKASLSACECADQASPADGAGHSQGHDEASRSLFFSAAAATRNALAAFRGRRAGHAGLRH